MSAGNPFTSLLQQQQPSQTPASAPSNGNPFTSQLSQMQQQQQPPDGDVDFSNDSGAYSPPGNDVAMPAPTQKAQDIAAGINQAAEDANPVNAVKNLPQSIWKSLPPVQLSDSVKHMLPVIDAYEKARSSGASIGDAIKAADTQAAQQDSTVQTLKQRVDDFKKNPTREGARAAADAAFAAVAMFGGLAPEADALTSSDLAETAAGMSEGGEAAAQATTTAPTVSKPNIITMARKGESAAQPQAQAAISDAAKAAAEDTGVAGGQPGQGVRTLLDDTIAQAATKERATYDALNQAAGTDLKSLYDYKEKLTDALDNPANIANEDTLQAKLSDIEGKIKDGEDAAAANGVDPDTLKNANAQTQQRYALQEVKQKLFNNESVVEGDLAHGSEETINVNSAIKAAQKLNKPSKFAPEGAPTRLQQALGTDGANALLKNLYAAQKTGQSAVVPHTVAKWLGYAGATALAGGLGTAAYKTLVK